MENLKRYGPTVTKNGFGTMQRLDNGGWVKFSEVAELLQTSHNDCRDCVYVKCFNFGHPVVDGSCFKQRR